MAERKSVATYESIIRDLKAKKYAPVYILMGDEPYYIDKIADYIAENVIEPDDRDFNQTIVFGADTTAAQNIRPLQRLPRNAIALSCSNSKGSTGIEIA